MTNMKFTIDKMVSDAEKLKDQLADADFLLVVKLTGGAAPSVGVCALAQPGKQVEEVVLTPGSTVGSLDKSKLTMLTMPDGTTRYCTGGAGNWFWIGAQATHA